MALQFAIANVILLNAADRLAWIDLTEEGQWFFSGTILVVGLVASFASWMGGPPNEEKPKPPKDDDDNPLVKGTQ